MDSSQNTLPRQLHLLGAGHHPSTKTVRRSHRFAEKSFLIGSLPIRPNRRVPVTVEFIVGHLDEIIDRVKRGTLLVQHSADAFVDPDELRAIAAVYRGETPPGPIVKLAPDDEPDDDVIDNPEDDGSHEDPSQVEEPMDEPAAEEPNPAEEAFGEDAPEAQEPAEEPMDAPEAPEEPTESYDAPEADYDAPGDLHEPEPAMEGMDEPDMGGEALEAAPKLAEEAPVDEAVEPAVEQRWLPEGFEKLGKKKLLALCKERDITVEGSRVDADQLVRLLTSWKNG